VGAVSQQDNKCKVNIHASTNNQNFSCNVHGALRPLHYRYWSVRVSKLIIYQHRAACAARYDICQCASFRIITSAQDWQMTALSVPNKNNAATTCISYWAIDNLGRGYVGARTDTTQQSGQTPDKEIDINHPRANSHISSRSHAVPLPCRAAKGLDCVFPIWFIQCGRVWFTHGMPRPCHAHDHAVLKATSQCHGTGRGGRGMASVN
jgi:hypothetical protein